MDLEQIIMRFDNALNDTRIYRDVFKTNHQEAALQINNIEAVRFRAISGDAQAENFMVDKLCRFIYANKDNEAIGVVNFDDLSDNTNEIKLILLKETMGLINILDIYKEADVFDATALLEVFDQNTEKIKNKFSSYNEQTKLNARIIFSNIYGLGIIDFLRGDFINEIGAIRKDFIYVIARGRKVRLRCISISINDELQNILKKAAMDSNIPFDKSNPISISSRRNTDRVTVAGFDVVPDENELYLNIRIFNLKSITLEALRDQYLTINNEIFEFFVLNQRGKGSFFVTSADMNSGKSTLLLAMLKKIPDHFAIGIIDPQNEMRTACKYPEKNVITMISNAQKTTDECFEYLLKTSRDILIVSEITNSNEVTQLINGSLRLNCGICATMHSLSPKEVIINLRNLMMRTDMYVCEKTAVEDITRGIDLIIHLGRIKDRIVVKSVDEITNKGTNTIFEYLDGRWIKKGRPSKEYENKIMPYLESEDIEKYESIFGDVKNNG